MVKRKFTTEELLSSESFIEFVKFGHHEKEWGKLENDPNCKKEIEEAREIIYAMEIRAETPTPLAKERIRRKIDSRINPTTERGYRNNRMRSREIGLRRVWYAAVIIVLLMAGGTSYFFFTDNKENNEVQQQLIVKSTHSGQKLTVFLPDGSRVKLNSNSVIRYPESFSASERIVQLEGEAFFEVEKNEDNPFIVNTGDVSTKVLGTSFNIRSYKKEETTNVILASGKVKVYSVKDGEQQSVLLEPGMKVNYIRGTNEMVKAKADLNKDLLWTEGVILFDKASREEVFKSLENWYGVSFDLSNYSKIEDNWDYSARFDNKSLENVLQSISYVKKFSYKIENEKVVISKN